MSDPAPKPEASAGPEPTWRVHKRPWEAPAPGTPPSDPISVASLRAAQRQSWLQGERTPAEEYLRLYPALAALPQQVLDLIYGEYELRQQLGEKPSLAEYQRRFPQFAEQLGKPVEVYWGPTGAEDAAAQAVTRRFVVGRDVPAAEPPAPLPLPCIPGYEILAELGRGGMGIVYKARQVRLKRWVALKTLVLGALAGPDARQRLRAEAEAVARLVHPNIVQVYEVGEEDGRPFCVLEYVNGGSLDEHFDGTPMPARVAAELVETLARAVHHAHEHGIVHRDLKPSNILLQAAFPVEDGNDLPRPYREPGPLDLARWQPKVTDFGIAKSLDGSARHTQTGTVLGTPGYMSPEQAGGDPRAVGPAADVYSLGALLYELLTGQVVFRGLTLLDTLDQIRHREPVSPRLLQPKVPRDLETACLKCLQKDPRRRYACARALADDLRAFLEQRPIQARPVGRVERLGRWCRRQPVLAALSAALVVAVAAGLAGVTWKWREAEANRWRAGVAQHAAEEKQEQAEQERQSAQRFSAHLLRERGLNLLQAGEFDHGLLWLGRGLEVCPADDDSLRTSLRRLLGAWGAHLHPQRAVLAHPPTQPKWVHTVAVSPDGRTIATGRADGLARLWNLPAGGRDGGPLSASPRATLPHGGRVTTLAFSPDGLTLVTAGPDGIARLWDVATGRPLEIVLPHQGRINAVVFSPDGRTLLTTSDDHTGRVWDAATGAARGQVLRHEARVRPGGFSPDGRTVLTGSDDGTVRLWDAASGRPVGGVLHHGHAVRAAVFSPDGKAILTGGNDGAARLWDAATGKPLLKPLLYTKPVAAVAISPDGQVLATGCEDKTVRLWRADTGEVIGRSLLHDGAVYVVAFSRDGKLLLSAGGEYSARLWDVEARQLLGSPLRHQGDLESAVFTPDDRFVVTASEDGTVRVWEIGACRSVGTPVGPRQNPIQALALRKDGQCLWTASRTARGYDLVTGQFVAEVRHPSGAVGSVALSPDGATVLTGGYDGRVRLWDAATGVPRGGPMRHAPPSWVHGVAFSPDGRWLVSASGDYDTHGNAWEKAREKAAVAGLWDAASGQLLVELRGHVREVIAVAVSPDGQVIATASRDRTARLWDRSGKSVGAPLRHHDWVTSVAFSPDGRTLLTASNDRYARLWEIATGELAGPPLRHPNEVLTAAFSPDGLTVATGCIDGRVRLWDAAAGKELGRPLRHPASVRSLVFLPDGRALVTACDDGQARRWDVPTVLDRQDQDVQLWLEVQTGFALDAKGGLLPLDEQGWRKRFQELQTREPK
jgi:eukaryotic-like serine/threonine-protein kinase